MTVFVPCPGVAEIRMLSIMNGRTVSNNLYGWREPSTITETSLGNLSFEVGLQYRLGVIQKISADVLFYAHIIKMLDVEDGVQVVRNTWGGLGGLEGPYEPNNVALRVNFHSEFLGRSGRGCNYVPGILKTDVSGSFISEERRLDIENGYNRLFAGFSAAGWQWVVLSRESGGVRRVNGVVYPVMSVSCPTRKLADIGRRLKNAQDILVPDLS